MAKALEVVGLQPPFMTATTAAVTAFFADNILAVDRSCCSWHCLEVAIARHNAEGTPRKHYGFLLTWLQSTPLLMTPCCCKSAVVLCEQFITARTALHRLPVFLTAACSPHGLWQCIHVGCRERKTDTRCSVIPVAGQCSCPKGYH